MEDFLSQVMAIVVPAAITIVGALATWGMAELTRFIRSKTQNENINGAISQISEVALSVVIDLEKSVKRASEDGKLTTSEAVAIRNEAIKKVKAMAPKALKTAERGGLGFVDDFVAGKVEQMVQVTKNMKAGV